TSPDSSVVPKPRCRIVGEPPAALPPVTSPIRDSPAPPFEDERESPLQARPWVSDAERGQQTWQDIVACSLGFLGLCGPENAGDCFYKALPTGCFSDQLPSSQRSKTVVFCTLVVLGNSPLGCNPSFLLEALQGRIERPMFHPERFVRHLL